MAETFKLLGSLNTASDNLLTPIYTVPSGRSFVGRVFISNSSPSDVTVGLHFRPNSGTDKTIIPLVALAGNSVMDLNGLAGTAGDALYADTTASNVTYTVFGTEMYASSGDVSVGGSILDSIVDAKGDLIVGSSDNAVARFGVGADGYALVADSSTLSGLRWDNLRAQTISTKSGSTYTLGLEDSSEILEFTNASGCQITIPTNASVNFPVGSQITLVQAASNPINVVAAGGVTLNSKLGYKVSAAQWVGLVLYQREVDSWVLLGDLVP
jgi:hypothetical protein